LTPKSEKNAKNGGIQNREGISSKKKSRKKKKRRPKKTGFKVEGHEDVLKTGGVGFSGWGWGGKGGGGGE